MNSKCSYDPGLFKISKVLIPAAMARGLPERVPAWYMGPAMGDSNEGIVKGEDSREFKKGYD
jgi:hypothetical protein